MSIGFSGGIFLVGSLGFAVCALQPERMDRCCVRVFSAALTRLRLLLRSDVAPEPDLWLCSRLIASTRAGMSLDSALNSIANEPELAAGEKERLRGLLHGDPAPDFLSQFLASALRFGLPVLSTLQLFQRVLASRKKLAGKARALTSQARAQAEVLSWLPWFLAAGILVVDSEWFWAAGALPLSWALWSVALALTGGGRAWMKRVLNRALQPSSLAERLEEGPLPDLTLRLLGEISVGADAETALERALLSLHDPEIRRALREPGLCEKARQLQGLITHATRTGAPLREDLHLFVTDLYQELEAKWEERVQRLPVVMLAPLFLCFFPGTLLVLAGLLFPLLGNLP